ncbi:dihydrofolate reductase [Spirillospora sp. CA-255316]
MMDRRRAQTPRISAIAALDESRVIGVDGRLPWRIPEDSRRFRRLTMGHVVIMGRKTYESIGKPLDGRTTIVVTRSQGYEAPNCIVVHSLGEALKRAREQERKEVFICGGEAIYRETLDLCDRIYLTLVKGNFEGSVRFPDYTQFKTVVEASSHKDSTHEYEFVVLEK